MTKQHSSGPTAVLYANPHSPNFLFLHRRLSELANSPQPASQSLRYVLRWKPLSTSGDSYLTGYGASLDLKKVDYLVIDDRKLTDTAAVQGERENEGLRMTETEESRQKLEEQAWMAKQLKTSKDNRQQSIGSLGEDELRGEWCNLLSSGESLSLTNLSSDLAVKAAYTVAKSKEPLKVLRQLSQDFPRHAVALARSASRPSKSFLKEVEELHETQIQAGGDDVWLNGKVLTGKEFQPFGLLSILRSERAIINSLTALNLTTADAVKLLTLPTIVEAYSKEDSASPFFDASDRIERNNSESEEGGLGAIAYWNDLEKEDDLRYARWNPALSSILRPMYPGSFPMVRRNLFNVILVMDLAKVETCKFLSESVQMATGRIALRWGFVPSNIEDPTSPSAQLARTFWLILDREGVEKASKYLRRLAFASVGETVDLKTAEHEAQKILKMSSEEITAALDQHQQREEPAKSYVRRLRANEAERGHVFINGQHVAFDSHFFQFLHQTIAMQVQMLAPLVYYGQLSDESDVSNHFYDLPSTFSSRSPLIFPPPETTIKTRAINLSDKTIRDTTFIGQVGEESALNSTVWVAGNLDSLHGAKLVKDVAQIIVSISWRATRGKSFLTSLLVFADRLQDTNGTCSCL